MIVVNDLVKEFIQKDGSRFAAVDHLSFHVNHDEIAVLLGVNGAGKTTTMRMLSTVFKPTAGSITIEGFDVATHPQEVRENLGFLSGDTGLYQKLTPREIIAYFGDLYQVPRETVTTRMNQMATILDMHSFLDKKIEFCSTGMKQKVSILRSIIHDPPVMILDEPTSGLDILTARNIISYIRRCKEEGKCVLFSTHIMREAERIGDRIIMIHKGRLLAEGSLEYLQDSTSLKDLDDIFVYYVNTQQEEGIQAHEF